MTLLFLLIQQYCIFLLCSWSVTLKCYTKTFDLESDYFLYGFMGLTCIWCHSNVNGRRSDDKFTTLNPWKHLPLGPKLILIGGSMKPARLSCINKTLNHYGSLLYATYKHLEWIRNNCNDVKSMTLQWNFPMEPIRHPLSNNVCCLMTWSLIFVESILWKCPSLYERA